MRKKQVSSIVANKQYFFLYMSEKTEKKYKTVELKNASEFDYVKHHDVLIKFPPGGKVGDAEWRLQYMHNSSVLADKTPIEFGTLVDLSGYDLKSMTGFKINVYFKDVLLDSMSFDLMYMARHFGTDIPKDHYPISGTCIDIPGVKIYVEYTKDNKAQKNELPRSRIVSKQ